MQLYGTMYIDNKGILHIADNSVEELVDTFGSPLIVLDEEEIRNNVNKYLEGFASYPGDFQILYASKAFSNRTLYKILEDEGINIDVVSGGELYTALKADFPAEKIYFHGNNKLPGEIKMALDNDIGGFFIDNFQEAALLNKIAKEKNKRIEAMIRLTPGLAAHTHDFMVTGKVDSKFGVGIENGDAKELIKLIINNYNNIKLTGIQSHIGSQIYDHGVFMKLIEIMFDFLNELKIDLGLTLNKLDLGGGLGIPHKENDTVIPIKEFVGDMVDKVIEEAKNNDYPLPELIVEPGRSVVGTAGTTLYRVGMIKEIENIKKYVTINGGMTDNIRPSLYGAEYDAYLANKCNDVEKEKVTVAGKCCETGDILIDNIKLPEAETGDILAVSCTGAYTYALSNNYNGIPRPAIVLVKNGEANLIVEREGYDDLIRHDVVPADY